VSNDDAVEVALRRIGGYQESLLVWVGVHTPAVRELYESVLESLGFPPGDDQDPLFHYWQEGRRLRRKQQFEEAERLAYTGASADLPHVRDGRPWVRVARLGSRFSTSSGRSGFSRALKRLVERGLISSNASSGGDGEAKRYASRVRLTPVGVKAVAHLLLRDIQKEEERQD
jgi:hypothetical protein